MTSDMQKVMVFAHRTNIDRYRRLLKTYLTVNEREFIERRLDEEERSLMEVIQKTSLIYSHSAA